ncbi:hypothetical protein PtrV1_04247 [Pyrenophora tritici-repentis]|nr:hypothetical protein PtrV1_04247 [Pyrenophora tritici-repentis]KAF7451928.1 hypothetical protein A1F99_037050 [Pyrenophora tritici-repentis]
MGKPADFADILNGVMWFQVVIGTVFVALRLYTRQYIVRNFGWDDVLMIVNLITFVGYVGCISVGVTHGVGKKTADIIRLELDYSKSIMWEAIGQGICIMGIAASKGSVAIFLLRIVMKRWHVAILWFCIITTAILCTITTTLLYTQCIPSAFLWDRTIKGGYCWLNFTQVGLTMGAWSASMDFVLAILPWHVIMGLNMKRKEKITIACGLSLGVVAGACSIVRTIELQSLSSMENYVYDTASMLLWSSSEVCLTIICACIPVLRPLYVRAVYGSQGDSSAKNSYPLKGYLKSKSSRGENGSPPNTMKIYMGPGGSLLQTTVAMGSDNASEEMILRGSIEQRYIAENMAQAKPESKEKKDIKVTTTLTSRDDFV